MKLPELKSFKNIAIVQTAFLGDVALTLQLAQTIKNYHPDCNLSFVTTPSAAPLVLASNAVDTMITYDKRGLQTGWRGMKFIAADLEERKIECIISPHRSFRTTILTYLARPVYSVSFNKSALSILYDRRVKYYLHEHEKARNLSLLKAFSDYSDIIPAEKVELDISDSDKSFIDSKLVWFGFTPKDEIIAIAPGSIWETKKWKEEYFAELAVNLTARGKKVVFVGSVDDSALCKRLAQKTNSFNLSGETSIPQTIYFLSNCKLLITNDSAPTHFAGLVGCRTITIYGPTSPMFGFAPTGENDRIIEVSDLKCKPCAIHGGDKCPKKTNECMVRITPEMVLREVEEINW